MSTEGEVRSASKKFYAGLNRMLNGNAEPLHDIWLHSTAVTAMHPIGGRQVGWDAVRASFEKVAELASDGKVELKDQIIHVVGDVAYEAGVEHGQVKFAGHPVIIDHRVTNIYQRESGGWKMTHHHTDTSPAMLDVFSRLQTRPAKTGTYQ
jgi:ketosteroid isomerase-like protein